MKFLLLEFQLRTRWESVDAVLQKDFSSETPR
jgi:hypothetical protein